MKHLKAYRIPFSGLSIGKHEFVFSVDKRFFDCYDYSIVKDGQLEVKVQLDKQANMMLADFSIDGIIKLTCDICLRAVDRKTQIEAGLIVKFDDEDLSEITDDILVLSKNDYEFSIADFIYEHINLSVPHYIKCDEQLDGEGCDQDMINVLKGLAAPDGSTEEVDPRWAMLEKLKRNN